MKHKFTKLLRSAGKNLLPAAVLVLAATAVQAQEAVQDIQSLHEDQIKPIVNTILTVVIFIAVAWVAAMFMMGKKQAATIGGFILAGALIFRLFPKILASIMGN